MTLSQLAVALAGLVLTAVLYCISITREGAKHGRDIEHRLSVLETKISVFWRVIEEGAVDLLHRDDTPEVDVLLRKAADHTLTEAEASQLIEDLKQIEHDRTRTKGESTAALILRAALVARYDG